MNSLSWLIYLANVTGNLGGFFLFLTLAGGFTTLVFGVCYFIYKDDVSNKVGRQDNYGHSLSKEYFEARIAALNGQIAIFKRMAMTGFTALVIFGTLTALMPERKTIMLIAASEVGERVVNSSKVQSVVDPSVELLKTYVDKELFETRLALDKMKKAARKALDD